MGLIYLDNAATSWPKPRCTVQAMARALEESGANPGRAGHRLSLEAGRIVERCRQALADMLGETDASRVAFAQNATDALNMAIHGAVRTGDHVVSTLIEHNSVLRPLSELARSGVITLTLVPPDADGRMDAREIERALTARTRLVVMTHTSNVLGLEQDVAAVGAVCRRRGVLFLVDAAQTAGHLPLEPKKWGCTMLAMPGHKGLLGPHGTGALWVADGVTLAPLRQGQPVSFRRFDCHSLTLLPPVAVAPSSLAVVEGSYSLHPALAPMYDLSVCLTLSPELQRRRILARNGEAMAQRFFECWIPLEQAYFDAMKPQTRCGFLIEADQLSDEAPL